MQNTLSTFSDAPPVHSGQNHGIIVGRIQLQTFINAPIERCFDISRSVDMHIDSSSQTKERAVAGVTSGLINLNDEVTWEAVHFGIKQRLRTRITEMNRPNSFTDVQINGIFHKFSHNHLYEFENGKTLMTDDLKFECPFGYLGHLLADRIVVKHIRTFLLQRNKEIKRIAETDSWKRFLKV